MAYNDRDLAGKTVNNIDDNHDGLIDDLQASKLISGASSAQDATNILTSAINPENIISNGDFDRWWGGTTSAPSSWSEEGSPVIAQDTVESGYGTYAVKITTTGADEGIYITLSGLKASTKYQFSCRAKATTGDEAKVVTTGASSNISETTSETSWTAITGEFETDGSATDVVLKLLGANSGDIVYFCGIHVNEGEALFGFIAPKTKVTIVTGTVTGGNTIPLPSGYTQDQCKWTVSINYGARGEECKYERCATGTKCQVSSDRVVTVGFYSGYNWTNSGTANYMIIGVK